jgi:hypothetical protein
MDHLPVTVQKERIRFVMRFPDRFIGRHPLSLSAEKTEQEQRPEDEGKKKGRISNVEQATAE